jgi:hypothetical protein
VATSRAGQDAARGEQFEIRIGECVQSGGLNSVGRPSCPSRVQS